MSLPRRLAVLRQFDGEEAILELEEDGVIYGEERVRSVQLPAAGRHDGAVFGLLDSSTEELTLRYLPRVSQSRQKHR